MVDLWIPREMDREALLAVCEETFGSRYRVYPSRLVGAPVVVRKSAWTGVGVFVKSGGGQTRLRMRGFAPSGWARVVKVSVLYVLYGWLAWRRMTREVHDALAERLAHPLESRPLPPPRPGAAPAGGVRTPAPSAPRAAASPARPTAPTARPGAVACPRCKTANPPPPRRPATLTCVACGFSGTLR